MTFSMTTSMAPPRATVTATGELDIFSALQVSRQLGAAAEAGCLRLLLDVGRVSFVDASALGLLDRTRRDLAVQEGSLDLVAAGPRFRRLCALTGLDGVFPLT